MKFHSPTGCGTVKSASTQILPGNGSADRLQVPDTPKNLIENKKHLRQCGFQTGSPGGRFCIPVWKTVHFLLEQDFHLYYVKKWGAKDFQTGVKPKRHIGDLGFWEHQWLDTSLKFMFHLSKETEPPWLTWTTKYWLVKNGIPKFYDKRKTPI